MPVKTFATFSPYDTLSTSLNSSVSRLLKFFPLSPDTGCPTVRIFLNSPQGSSSASHAIFDEHRWFSCPFSHNKKDNKNLINYRLILKIKCSVEAS
ncbi:hypothetical protein CEXT_237611 [Caerostris extrusa]|uniref:Uncharacterized protein n=1 Tax=Caerostris extrusa TaxID=172846 RepID=A0AAV4UCW0_CAEEX|nr:hypothetical protein CEXT_237611 [Caerostris extrusa]